MIVEPHQRRRAEATHHADDRDPAPPVAQERDAIAPQAERDPYDGHPDHHRAGGVPGRIRRLADAEHVQAGVRPGPPERHLHRLGGRDQDGEHERHRDGRPHPLERAQPPASPRTRPIQQGGVEGNPEQREQRVWLLTEIAERDQAVSGAVVDGGGDELGDRRIQRPGDPTPEDVGGDADDGQDRRERQHEPPESRRVGRPDAVRGHGRLFTSRVVEGPCPPPVRLPRPRRRRSAHWPSYSSGWHRYDHFARDSLVVITSPPQRCITAAAFRRTVTPCPSRFTLRRMFQRWRVESRDCE